MRLFKARASNPASVSADSSGLRFGLPSALWRRPGVSVPDELTATTGTFVVVDANVTSADVAPGCTPEAPYALRRRSWSNHRNFGKNDSSVISHDTLSFGYTTF